MIIIKFLEMVLGRMSDQIRAEIEGAVLKLETITKQTANPWDDLLVSLIKVALGMD